MNGNDAAYPFQVDTGQVTGGLTKRELFAAMAMQGLLSNNTQEGYWREFAKRAVDAADALIAELSKEVQ